MKPAARDFLYELLRTPSPTGGEQRIQRKVYDQFKGVAHSIEPDIHGNLILSLNPRAKRKIMIAGHCDQIGFLVKYISPDGYIYVDTLGGTDYGANDEKQVRERVNIGDYVTFELKVTELQNDLIAAPGLDNKAGLFVCLEALRQCAESGCTVGLYVVSTV